MALETPPGVLNDVETDSSVQRHTTTALAGGRDGVCGVTDFAVTQSSTPGMSVAVAAGYALVKGTTTSNQGLYSAHNDASVDDVAISPGDPTNDRHDIVGILVRDAMYSGSDSDVVLHVVEGTPAGSPSDPTLPDSFLPLARVTVEANESTSIVNGDIDDLREFAGDYFLDDKIDGLPNPTLIRHRRHRNGGTINSSTTTAMFPTSQSGTVLENVGGITFTADPTNGFFTVPVSGTYAITVLAAISGGFPAGSRAIINAAGASHHFPFTTAGGNQVGTLIRHLDASDVITSSIFCGGTGAASTVWQIEIARLT